MIFGYYSLRNVYSMHQDPEQREELERQWITILFYFLLWVTSIVLLIYYWSRLEVWARVIGVIGLIVSNGGPLVTLLVIWLGQTKNEIVEIPM